MNILCIDTTVLKEVNKVQKDINLGGLLNNHTKYFSNVKSAEESNYAPLNFVFTVRSMYDNTVLAKDGTCYSGVVAKETFNHRGYDLCMFLTAIGVSNLFSSISPKVSKVVAKQSEFMPIGLYYYMGEPLVYSHVIFSDDGMKMLAEHLSDGVSIVPISELSEEKNLKALLDTLIILKR